MSAAGALTADEREALVRLRAKVDQRIAELSFMPSPYSVKVIGHLDALRAEIQRRLGGRCL